MSNSSLLPVTSLFDLLGHHDYLLRAKDIEAVLQGKHLAAGVGLTPAEKFVPSART